MYKLLVNLKVKDFEIFEEYEKQASDLMSCHGGQIVSAYETVRNNDRSGEEVHIVSFEKEEGYRNYINDPKIIELSRLRDKAILKTEVKIITKEKSYS